MIEAPSHGNSHGTVPGATGLREGGTNENTNGLIRQYIPKRASMKHLTQTRCTEIALKLNNRPRKRHGYLSPIEIFANRAALGPRI